MNKNIAIDTPYFKQNFIMDLSGIDIFDNTEPKTEPKETDALFDSDTDEMLIKADNYLMNNYDTTSENHERDEIDLNGPQPKKVKPDKSELLQFIDQGLNKNTKMKTNRDAGKFIEYMNKHGEHRQMIDLPKPELDYYVGSYLMQLTRPNGEPYEPSTITSIHRFVFLIKSQNILYSLQECNVGIKMMFRCFYF